jgi:crotonobetainyl-CoA:carnitine CoA-transferase CaiB-like acyl-CoA transferase
VALLNAATVSCGPINDMGDLEQDPHVQARGTLVSLHHPVNGHIRTAANPVKLSESPVAYRLAPPRIGEHTDEVLQEWLDTPQARLAALRACGAI